MKKERCSETDSGQKMMEIFKRHVTASGISHNMEQYEPCFISVVAMSLFWQPFLVGIQMSTALLVVPCPLYTALIAGHVLRLSEEMAKRECSYKSRNICNKLSYYCRFKRKNMQELPKA